MRLSTSIVVAALLSATAACGGGNDGLTSSTSDAAFAQQPNTSAGYKILYRFKGGRDGASPFYGRLVEANGLLFGTTYTGGGTSCPAAGSYVPGCGTVFQVNPSTGEERVLYRFKGGAAGSKGGHDGAHPWGDGLIVVNGMLYGTTSNGGGNYGCDNGNGCGTVFEVNPSTGKERVVHVFQAVPDAQSPQAGLVAVGHAIYGIAGWGGTNACIGGNCGAIYKLTPSGSRYTERVLYSFQGGADGDHPLASMIVANGKLYGTTPTGGSGNCTWLSGFGFAPGCGSVFEANPSTGAERVIYAFQGGNDGAFPSARLIYAKGALYSTTAFGGTGDCSADNPPNPYPGCGTVFEVNPSSGAERVIYSFVLTTGGYVTSPVVEAHGALYGTAQAAFGYGLCCGIVFKLTPSGSGFNESTVYRFGGRHNDGALPLAGLIDVNGTLYGTTVVGGGTGCGGKGCGTVFEVTP